MFILILPCFLELECSSPNPIEHGKVYPKKGNYEEGDVIQIICLEGYTLRGSELIQCYYFGWYPQFPICEGTSFILFIDPYNFVCIIACVTDMTLAY